MAMEDDATDLIKSAMELVAYAVEVPTRELEAQQWLADAQALLDSPQQEQGLRHRSVNAMMLEIHERLSTIIPEYWPGVERAGGPDRHQPRVCDDVHIWLSMLAGRRYRRETRDQEIIGDAIQNAIEAIMNFYVELAERGLPLITDNDRDAVRKETN